MSDERERVTTGDAEQLAPRTEEGADFEGHGKRVGKVIEAAEEGEPDFEGHRFPTGGKVID